MATTTKTNALRHSIVVSKGKQVTDISIKLDDDCRNGHEDFSITASIREQDDRGRWVSGGCGACHDHILSVCPELKLFVDLHLCTWEGVPMHCAANAFYWLAGHLGLSYVEYHGGTGSSAKSQDECLKIFKDHVRCTDAELPALLECRSAEELKIALEDLGIVARWKDEANAAIKQLEAWTGREFESSATRGRWEPATKEERDTVKSRRESGYYSPEAISARDAEKAAKAKADRRKKLLDDYQKAVRKMDRKLEVELFLVDNFEGKVNCIYYDHTNELSFNWTSTEKLVTLEEFRGMADVFSGFRTAILPDGVKLVWNERPKY